jgi:hypothetical protein
MQPCQQGFKDAEGNMDCKQQITGLGAAEQVSASVAYQFTYMSDTTQAVPKFNGRTLLRQLETAYNHPEVPVITITGWNEWVALRFCPPVNGVNDLSTNCTAGNDTLPNGNKVFIDTYNVDYNRDIEPGGGKGTFYYDLMKNAIARLRAGKNPATVE